MIEAVCAKEIITVSTLISPLPGGKYKLDAFYIPHVRLACLLPGVFHAACKNIHDCIIMWKEIWIITIAVTIMENSITSEPLTYWSNTGRHEHNLFEHFSEHACNIALYKKRILQKHG